MSLKLLIVIFFALKVCYCHNYKLQQVLILSRHNVRTPLSKNLVEYTPKTWPTWKEKNGYLTAKGVLLEGYMGEYFSAWLVNEGLLNNNCPDTKTFYVYANNAERTLASAKAFVDKAFPLCNITIHQTAGSQRDPIFNPVIHSSCPAFKTKAVEQMQLLLKTYHLNNSYEDIENILDYRDSKYCKIKQKCDLVADKNKVFVNTGFKPNLEGPLKISKSVIDSFIMENYEGFPEDTVAWGMLETTKQWNAILDLTRSYHSVIFNTTLVARDVAKPLLKYMNDLLHKQYKVILLMGHDANIYTVLKSMNFKPYVLNNQYEMVPAGGKLVFQKWLDKDSKKLFAKIDYVYQGTLQMREGKSLSLLNPPEFTLLELEGCKIDENGFCPWDVFESILNIKS